MMCGVTKMRLGLTRAARHRRPGIMQSYRLRLCVVAFRAGTQCCDSSYMFDSVICVYSSVMKVSSFSHTFGQSGAGRKAGRSDPTPSVKVHSLSEREKLEGVSGHCSAGLCGYNYNMPKWDPNILFGTARSMLGRISKTFFREPVTCLTSRSCSRGTYAGKSKNEA